MDTCIIHEIAITQRYMENYACGHLYVCESWGRKKMTLKIRIFINFETEKWY